jgi:glycosyltransferase involved in cell wall biosynthesis
VSRSNWYALEHWTGYHFNGHPSPKHLAVARYISNKIKKVLAVSEDLSQAMTNLGVKNANGVVYNAVNTKYFSFQERQGVEVFTFLHVSSLKGRHKNFEMLLKSLAVIENLPNTKLRVINSGDYQPYLNLIKDLNLLDKVEFMGKMSIDQVALEMQKSNAFVLSSNYENMPCVIEEALCTGLPVLSTDVGGIREIINDKNGILVEKGNHLELAKSMDQIINHYSQYNQSAIAENAKNLFSNEAVLKQIESSLEI